MAATYEGILNINKPRGWTSQAVVARVRRLLGARTRRGSGRVRVGHAGTLDPLATGVLLVCVGQATRIAEYLTAAEKTYRAEVELGISTDTYDAEGQTTDTAPVPHLEAQELLHILSRFTGEILQAPPPYSAIKQQGVPAYRRARRGEIFELAPRKVAIHSIDLLWWRSPRLCIELVCESGTYVRSLAHDLGRSIGCGAILTDLTRLRSGSFTLQEAITLDGLSAAVDSGQLEQHLWSLETALGALSPVRVDWQSSDLLLRGQPIPGAAASPDRLGYALDPQGAVRAIMAYDPEASVWRPKKVFPPDS
jgi:tRNA pseudouridine55 synthase